jgi:hypothetical protein
MRAYGHGARRSCVVLMCVLQEHYEQGAFVLHVLSDPRFRHAVRLVPWMVLQNAHM